MQEVPLNKKHIYLFGMRRSGNHVFADWLKAHDPDGGWIHYNNCTCDENGIVKTGQIDGDEDSHNSLITFEDLKYKEIMSKLPPRRDILLLRDPYNLFASRLQLIRTRDDAELDMICQNAFNLWKEHALAFCQYEPYLIVNFNLWYKDQEDRKRISETLGFEFTDEGFGSKAGWRFSGGSSFGNTPDPLNSYHENMAEDQEFLKLFDDEIVKEASVIFGLDPPQNLSYDEEFNKGVEKAVNFILLAIHKCEMDTAFSMWQDMMDNYPLSSRLKQLGTFFRNPPFSN